LQTTHLIFSALDDDPERIIAIGETAKRLEVDRLAVARPSVEVKARNEI
jgi:hypothetical protein